MCVVVARAAAIQLSFALVKTKELTELCAKLIYKHCVVVVLVPICYTIVFFSRPLDLCFGIRMIPCFDEICNVIDTIVHTLSYYDHLSDFYALCKFIILGSTMPEGDCVQTFAAAHRQYTRKVEEIFYVHIYIAA